MHACNLRFRCITMRMGASCRTMQLLPPPYRPLLWKIGDDDGGSGTIPSRGCVPQTNKYLVAARAAARRSWRRSCVDESWHDSVHVRMAWTRQRIASHDWVSRRTHAPRVSNTTTTIVLLAFGFRRLRCQGRCMLQFGFCDKLPKHQTLRQSTCGSTACITP